MNVAYEQVAVYQMENVTVMVTVKMNAANAVVITVAAQIVPVFQMEIMSLITVALVMMPRPMIVIWIVLVLGVAV